MFAKFTEIVTGVSSTSTNNFSFYPNPSADYIHTELELSSLTVLNSEGSIVSEFTSNDSVYNISKLNAGIYVIKATGVDGTPYTSTLVKK